MQRREENLIKLVNSYLGQDRANTFKSYIRQADSAKIRENIS
jgi:hypothetical protein